MPEANKETTTTAPTEAPSAAATEGKAGEAKAENTNTEASAEAGHGHAKKEMPKPTTGSSIFPADPQFAQNSQFKMPTWGLISILIVAFFILKFFIYIKDSKRHGK